jgi:hypothetical protein
MKRTLALAAFQVVTMLGLAGYHEHVWATAPTFRIRLQPRDPFDLLRGRYFVLNPLDARIPSESPFLTPEAVARFLGSETGYSGAAEVGFCASGNVHRVCALRRRGVDASPSPAQYWSRGFVSVAPATAGWSVTIDLGLRRFFIPNRVRLPGPENALGWELEVSHRPGLTPLPRRLYFRGAAVGLS